MNDNMKVNKEEINKLLSPYSFQDVLRGLDLSAKGIEGAEKDKLLGKVDGYLSSSRGDYLVEIKKYHDLRYPSVLPSMFESFASRRFLRRESRNRKVNLPVLLIARVKKLSESFLDNALDFFNRYESKEFYWVLIDDSGKLVGNFEGRILDRSIRKEVNRKIELHKKEYKQNLSFSPIQQWLLKCLLLNGLDNANKGMFGEKLWPIEFQRKIYDYKVLSKFSGVSESSCFNFVKLLQEQEYLYIDGHGYQFRDLKRLFDMWEMNYYSSRKEEVYLSPIRPLISLEEWREEAFHFFHKVSHQNEKNLAVIMSGHLACRELGLSWSNNKSVIFHAKKDQEEVLEKFIKKMKLRPSDSPEDGIKLVLHKNDFPVIKVAREHRELNITDPIQLLLDVQYSGGRGREQADYIYERVLEKHFRNMRWKS